jgi:pSer/pThr/pTyr-binding forkhead associated (FHA) protein
MISHEHCVVKQDAGQLWIKDLGSRNGTFLDAHKARPVGGTWTSLSGHDAVYLGSHRLSISLLAQLNWDNT